MLQDQFDSNVMLVEVRDSTVRYAFRRRPHKIYEIRGVSFIDLLKLQSTNRNDSFSTGATVQLLTHLYKGSHFHADGTIAPPSKQRQRSLVKLTPFRP